MWKASPKVAGKGDSKSDGFKSRDIECWKHDGKGQ